MTRYRVQFQEVINYDVEFETDEELLPPGVDHTDLSDDHEVPEDEWFEAMDNYDPDWIKTGGVMERDLTAVWRLPDTPEPEKPA